MPFSLSALALTRLNFAAPLKTFIDGLETSTGTAQTTANDANALANTKYAKPVGNIPAADLADAAAVKHNGTVLRAEALSQAAYDGLATKVATTLYVII